MDKQLKQRIIGGLLLLLLAAIITPLLLRTPEEVRVALDMSIPPPPTLPQMAIEPVVDQAEQEMALAEIEQDRDTVRRAGEDYDQRERDAGAPAAQPATDVPTQAPPAVTEAPAVRQDPPPLTGWAVQVGSYSSADSAGGQAQQLRDAGYRAFTRTVEQGGQTLHRVFAGPELDRDAAVALRERLASDADLRLQGLVVSLAP